MWGCPKDQRPKTRISFHTERNPWFNSGAAQIFLGQAWETCSVFPQVCKYVYSPKTEFSRPMAIPKEQNLSLLFLNFLVWEFHSFTSLLILFPTPPKPHHLENSPSRPVHACQLEGSQRVGRVGLLEKQTGIKYPQTNSQTFPFHLQEENNSGVNM